MVILIQIDGIQEGPFFRSKAVIVFFLYVQRVHQNNIFYSAKDISLTVARNLTGQITDNKDLVIMLKYDTFS